MSKVTRKEFLGLGAAIAGATGARALPAMPSAGGAARPLPPMRQRGAAIEADLVVINATVVTMDPARPRAEADV